MGTARAHALRLGALGLGDGSLLLFAYFVLFGRPFFLRIANSNGARLALDSLLCPGVFLQHSGMIRRGAKDRVAGWVEAAYQPAVYSIASGAALILLVLLWQPTDGTLFQLPGWAHAVSIGRAMLAAPGLALGGSFPRGLRSVRHASDRGGNARQRGPSVPFVTRGAYRYARHPLYFFMLVFLWSTPGPTADRLLFNVLWTGWIVLGTQLEERDLVAEFGERYREYQWTVPMLIPSRPKDRGRTRSSP